LEGVYILDLKEGIYNKELSDILKRRIEGGQYNEGK